MYFVKSLGVCASAVTPSAIIDSILFWSIGTTFLVAVTVFPVTLSSILIVVNPSANAFISPVKVLFSCSSSIIVLSATVTLYSSMSFVFSLLNTLYVFPTIFNSSTSFTSIMLDNGSTSKSLVPTIVCVNVLW